MPSYVVYVDGPGEHTVDVKPENEILYVTQVDDLMDSFEARYGDDSWDTLDDSKRAEVIDAARDYMENFNSGMYDWGEALSDSMESVITDEEAADLQAIADGAAEAEAEAGQAYRLYEETGDERLRTVM